jgi:hypothetical protein
MSRNRRSKVESPRFLQPISPRSMAQVDDGGGVEPAAAEVARLSNWRPGAQGKPPADDFDEDAYAAEAAASVRQRFGLGPVTTRPPHVSSPPASSAASPGAGSERGSERAFHGAEARGSGAPFVAGEGGGDDVVALQAALAEKTRESERLQELLLAVSPPSGVNPAKLAEIQVGGGAAGLVNSGGLCLNRAGARQRPVWHTLCIPLLHLTLLLRLLVLLQAGRPGPNGLPPDARDSKILDLSRATRKVRTTPPENQRGS